MKNNSKSCLQQSMRHERKAKKDRNKCADHISRSYILQLVREVSMLASTEALCRTVFGGQWGGKGREATRQWATRGRRSYVDLKELVTVVIFFQ